MFDNPVQVLHSPSKRLPTDRTGHQRAQWNSSPPRHDSSHMRADDEASQHKRRGRLSWGGHDDSQGENILSGSVTNLRAPKSMIAPDPLVGVPGIPDAKSLWRRFLLSQASTKRELNLTKLPLGASSPAASKHKVKTLSRESHDELSEPQESRYLQLRKQMDPRWHLFDVLDMHAQRDQTLAGPQRRVAPVQAGSIKSLRAPGTMIVPDPDAKSSGRKSLLSRASTIGASPSQGGSSPLQRLASAPSHLFLVEAMNSSHSAMPPPWRIFFEPGRIQRSAASSTVARSGTDPGPQHFTPPRYHPRTLARHASPPPSSKSRIRICWLPSAVSREFLYERAPGALPFSASLPSLPDTAAMETYSARAPPLKRSFTEPLGLLGSSSSQHRRTPEPVL